ncbi:hypothetical protein ASE03_26350 [Kitasatospora sp. Root187]|nr:hypothetical protein ASC99_10995 [Kitasatospora sp. Root107]KRB70163.1 hypothetical protein ASE03_26350 [Kitasatospora sp. Root187]
MSSYEEQLKLAKAEHDRAFPEVAAACADVASGPSTTPSTTPSTKPGGSSSPDPEQAKHAENHAYLTTVRMTPEAECRGGAHAKRITAALTLRAAKASLGADDVYDVLAGLGYPRREHLVEGSAGALGFTFMLPGVGPCITGKVGPPVVVEAHGVYVEGGCNRPRGGH